MTTGSKQETGQSRKMHLWFGFGNYGGQPVQQIGGGIIRNPDMVEEMQGDSEKEHSPFFYIAGLVLGLTFLVMVFVWVLSLLIR